MKKFHGAAAPRNTGTVAFSEPEAIWRARGLARVEPAAGVLLAGTTVLRYIAPIRAASLVVEASRAGRGCDTNRPSLLEDKSPARVLTFKRAANIDPSFRPYGMSAGCPSSRG
jgi:hypothetical protein